MLQPPLHPSSTEEGNHKYRDRENSPPWLRRSIRRFGGGGGCNMKHIHNNTSLRIIRKELRNNATSAEATLWKYLKNSQLRGNKFRRQHSIGDYIVDFYCPSAQLAIELDGEVHAYDTINERDRNKNVFLKQMNVRLLRFENKLVFTNLEAVLGKISSCLSNTTTPSPLLS